MKNIIHSVTKSVSVILLCLVLAACNKVTQANFDKIQSNMTMKEVTAILGNPSSSDSITIGGLSGTSAVWKEGDKEIVIQFLNGTVFFKTFTSDGGKQGTNQQ